MNIGFVGVGKLGFPVCLALEHYGGHTIFGYDLSDKCKEYIRMKKYPHKEKRVNEIIKTSSKFDFYSLPEVIDNCDMIFTAIQTPHTNEYGGHIPLPLDRKDFDYSFLTAGVEEVAKEAQKQKKHVILIVISTCLPGTIDREVKPILNKYKNYCHLVYNPFFIAMGQVIDDFIFPEFVLLGYDEEQEICNKVFDFYWDFYAKISMQMPMSQPGIPPIQVMEIKEAELVKVYYNSFITMKIAMANACMELCEKLNINTNTVMNAIKHGKRRIISESYLEGGMVDGGGCHPRDCIAMSYLATREALSWNVYEELARSRDLQTRYMADYILSHYDGLPIYIMGKAFKPDTHLEDGSPSNLLQSFLLRENHTCIAYDPYIDKDNITFEKGCYFIATKHSCWLYFDFPEGSIVIDPHRYIEDNDKYTVLRIGEKKHG